MQGRDERLAHVVERGGMLLLHLDPRWEGVIPLDDAVHAASRGQTRRRKRVSRLER